MKNKGFTLIELLAVIVILAILMVIAIPKILDVINGSKRSAWDSNVKLIKESIELSIKTNGYTLSGLCNNNETTTEVDVTNKIKEISKFDNTSIKCKKDTNHIFNLLGSNNFNGRSATITCTSNSICTYEITTVEPAPAPVSFATDSWATIAENPTSELYHVGDEKTISMDVDGDNVNETYTVRIANKSTPNVCKKAGYSQTACGFVIEFKDIIVTSLQMNNSGTNEGGWDATALRTYLNGDFYNKLPADLKPLIDETTPVVSGSGSGGVSPNTNDKIYLLSTLEVGLPNNKDNKIDAENDTRTLDYYSTYTNNSYRVKKKNGTAITWWLRSAFSTGTGAFFHVADTGAMSTNLYSANYSRGVAPAFRIGN